MTVIGIVGRNGSGKDTLAKYLQERCAVPMVSIGDLVRELARQEGISPTRAHLHDLSVQYMNREGQDYFAQRAIEQILRHQWAHVTVSGIRTPVDVAAFREQFGDAFLLVHVAVDDPQIRYQRQQQRGKERDPDTYEEYRVQEDAEEALFHLRETIREADVSIRNDDTLPHFHRRIELTFIQGCR
ncbi:MAG: AAA family ATPase [Armatimonadota bacterium]